MCPQACDSDNTAQPTARGYTLPTGQAQRKPPSPHTGVQMRPGSRWGRWVPVQGSGVPGRHVEKACWVQLQVYFCPSQLSLRWSYFSISDNGPGL